ncbi:MAG: zinc-dependent alcohol dehydrogenase family protein [Clostridiales bacterium]|nr:zinc-dependent alcohol dehydrogenase family protein [Clostridiales bacterium]
MIGAYFLGNQTIETRPLVLPDPGPGQVLVRVAACGVCGTDVHIYHGGKGSADVTPPVILGHEFSGIIEKLGDGVEDLEVGQLVTVDPNIYCGKCRPCRQGQKQMCHHMRAVGVNMDGGFAERCLVPSAQCVPVPEGTDPELAAMAEPLACCLHGIDRAGIRPGENVLVVGGGTIGQIMLQLARIAGAAKVILSEPVEARRKLAVELGADGAIDPIHEDLNQRLEELLGCQGADVVIECVGNPRTSAQAIDAAARCGRILLFGVPNPEAVLQTRMHPIFQKELTIMGSFVNPDTHSRAVALLASGQLKLKPLITHRYPISQLEDAIMTQTSDKSIKVLVKAEVSNHVH